MNNFKKIGVSALAGSLAMTAAHAAEYSMSGDAIIKYASIDSPTAGGQASNGKGFGVDTDLYFTASGETEQGWTVSFFQAANTHTAWSNSSSQVTIGMGSMGTVQFNNVVGSKANGIDDVMPAAYNETWDGLSADNPSFFGNLTTAGSVDYRIPAIELAGATINASYTYDPSANAAPASKGAVAATSVDGDAMTLQIDHESGVSIGGGVETVNDGQGKTLASDTERTTAYVKYSNGPLTVAYQEAYNNVVNATGVEGADQEASFMGIAYTAGNLTVSYGESDLAVKAVSKPICCKFH